MIKKGKREGGRSRKERESEERGGERRKIGKRRRLKTSREERGEKK